MLRDCEELLRMCLEKEMPFAAYRKPAENVITIVRQQDRKLHALKDFNSPGFICAPFDPSEQIIRILPDEVRKSVLHAEPIAESGFPGQKGDCELEKERYLELIRQTREKILQGSFRKVVLTRKIQFPVSPEPIKFFKRVLSLYPSAFGYLWFHPDTGIWIGASPELLLHSSGTRFRTMSLAGTRKFSGNCGDEWGQKERAEQDLVTRYIRDALEDKVAALQIKGPETVRAGELLHLQSLITGSMGSAKLEDLLAALHPTPAVCGIPKTETFKFLLRHENYDRLYYTGYLGELNMDVTGNGQARRHTNLYVNLRCMSLNGNRATIYVGGGITGESVAESEWEETCDKAQTMLRVLS